LLPNAMKITHTPLNQPSNLTQAAENKIIKHSNN